MTRISLVRHGQVHNPGAVFYGRLPGFRLSDSGKRQAMAAGRALSTAPVDAIFSSPLLRARQTAECVRSFHAHRRIRLSRLLLEVKTPFEGLPAEAADARRGDVYSGSGPEFDQPVDVARRIRKFLMRVRKAHPGGHVVAATHGDVIAFALLWAAGMELAPQNKTRLAKAGVPYGYPATGSITTLAYETGSPDERPTVAHLRTDPEAIPRPLEKGDRL